MTAPSVTRARGGGTELGYAEITSQYSGTTTGGEDVTGLSVTVTVGSRPIKVIFDARNFGNTVAAAASIVIQEGATVLAGAQHQNAANVNMPVHRERRLTPTAGSHTYKITAYAGTAGTLTIGAAATSPAFIQVVEV